MHLYRPEVCGTVCFDSTLQGELALECMKVATPCGNYTCQINSAEQRRRHQPHFFCAALGRATGAIENEGKCGGSVT